LVKLGGSCIDPKAQDKSRRVTSGGRKRAEKASAIDGVVSLLTNVAPTSALVLGAGGTAHSLAADMSLQKGIPDDAEEEDVLLARLAGLRVMAEIQAGVRDVLAAAHERCVMLHPVCIVSAGIRADHSDDEAVALLGPIIAQVQASGYIPLLYGSVVLGGAGRIGIVSGDRIMIWLARLLPVERAFFLTTSRGVRNPRSGKVIEELDASDEGKCAHLVSQIEATQDAATDVTNAMAGKVSAAIETARILEGPVFICSVADAHRVRQLAEGIEATRAMRIGMTMVAPSAGAEEKKEEEEEDAAAEQE
jgi:isopentenyl phosphate kinase